MKNKIEDLRNHLFVALERLNEAEDPEEIRKEIGRAKAVAEVAQVGVGSARAENEFLKVTGATQGTGFMPTTPRAVGLEHNGRGSSDAD